MQADAFCVVVLPQTTAGDGIAVTTRAILVFQKGYIGFFGFILLELFKDSELALRYAASTNKHIIDSCLRNIKAGTILGVGVVDDLFLLCFCRQRLFIRIQPCIHENHPLNPGCQGPPLHIHFALTIQI